MYVPFPDGALVTPFIFSGLGFSRGLSITVSENIREIMGVFFPGVSL